jgi:hypothetical protein
MESGSFEFIQSTLTVLAVGASIAALLFVAFEFGEARGRRPLHQWLRGGWRVVTGSGWLGLAETCSRAYMDALGGIIRDYFQDADKGTVLSVLFVGLVFVLIPAAALLNLAIGGSPFVAKYYLSLLVVLVVLNFTGESRRLAVINGAAAVYLGASVFLVIPLYVFRSFATLARIDVFPHAVPESVLVAPLCYLVAYGIKLVADSFVFGRLDGTPPRAVVTALNGFLAALPVAFVLTFVALLVGSSIDTGSTPSPSWQYLVSGMGFASAGLASMLVIMGWALGAGGPMALVSGCVASVAMGSVFSWALLFYGRLASTQALSAEQAFVVLLGQAPGTGRLQLGADFWVMHLPMVPAAVLVGAITLAWLAKAIASPVGFVLGREYAVRRPLLLAGVVCAVLVGIFWLLAAGL